MDGGSRMGVLSAAEWSRFYFNLNPDVIQEGSNDQITCAHFTQPALAPSLSDQHHDIDRSLTNAAAPAAPLIEVAVAIAFMCVYVQRAFGTRPPHVWLQEQCTLPAPMRTSSCRTAYAVSANTPCGWLCGVVDLVPIATAVAWCNTLLNKGARALTTPTLTHCNDCAGGVLRMLYLKRCTACKGFGCTS